jgi:hypothetical protein
LGEDQEFTAGLGYILRPDSDKHKTPMRSIKEVLFIYFYLFIYLFIYLFLGRAEDQTQGLIHAGQVFYH